MKCPLYLAGTLLLATLAMPSKTQAQVPGRSCCLDANRGVAVCSPLESPDGPDICILRAYGRLHCWDEQFYPYYSPLIPISKRWCPTDYVSYYPGYCRWNSPDCDWCCANALNTGAGTAEGARQGNFGAYTGASNDEARLVHLGGGSTSPNQRSGPDIIDTLESQRGANGFYYPSQSTR